ncbi:NAD(P)/FAD-dependent oxidoreductase [Agrobacterium vitis]|uniref:NAD(P)/FAD-dependent oxidoreductase n=1 Tax=Agrobacterium vitis TaxID=373 RepID=UPI00307D1473
MTVCDRTEDFDILVLATGSRARKITVPGSNLGNIHYLRTIADAARLGSALVGAHSVVVIGGGFIGLEFASVARTLGATVTVVEAASRLCGRALSLAMSDWLLALHRDNGVSIKLSKGIARFEGHGAVTTVHLDDGTIEADVVVVGIGSEPNDQLAMNAGLEVSASIIVGSDLKTKANNVFAIGDCARFPAFPWLQPIRLESVQNAVDQAKHLAASICGAAAVYRKVPWFWTEQFGHKIRMAGLSQYGLRTEIVPGDACGRFNVRHYLDNRLIAIDSVNDAKAHVAARKELASVYCSG